MVWCKNCRALLGFELYLGLIHVSCVTSHFSSSQRVQLRIGIIYMKCVCSLFILVLVVQIVHAKKPRLTSKQNREQIYVGTVGHCPGGHHHRFPISLIWGRLCLPHHLNHSFYLTILSPSLSDLYVSLMPQLLR
jgi:tellurite resistance protein TehA-like permease